MNANFLGPVLDFLSELEQHNRRDWFEQNRPAYEAARQRFETFVDEVIDRLRTFEDLGPLSARDCTMRIFRDVRFSKDKSPYRTNMAASIARGGRHSTRIPYYLHVQPHDQSMAASGLYMPTPEQLARFRERIDEDPAPFKAILTDERFRQYFGEIGGERLKRAPAGYPRRPPRAGPAAPQAGAGLPRAAGPRDHRAGCRRTGGRGVQRDETAGRLSE